MSNIVLYGLGLVGLGFSLPFFYLIFLRLCDSFEGKLLPENKADAPLFAACTMIISLGGLFILIGSWKNG